MKPFLSLLLIFSLVSSSCKEKKETGGTDKKQEPVPVKQETVSGNVRGMMDSIRSLQPLKLSFSDEHSDVDALIPLGYNTHGSLAFLIDENSGGSSALQLGILPAYQDFSLQSVLGSDEEKDTILLRNQDLVCLALRSQGIQLGKAVEKTTAAELQKKYDIKFEIKKTYGAPDPDDPSGKKTMASVEINWRQGESDYPSEILLERYNMYHNVYDVYISDCLLIKGEEGVFGFVVVVTESRGFEGYTRKSIEVKHLGVVKGI